MDKGNHYSILIMTCKTKWIDNEIYYLNSENRCEIQEKPTKYTILILKRQAKLHESTSKFATLIRWRHIKLNWLTTKNYTLISIKQIKMH